MVIWSDAAWNNRKDLSSTLGFFSGVTTTGILHGGRHYVSPIHYRSRRSMGKVRSTLSAEVHTLADAEQELYFTKLQVAQLFGFPVNMSNVDETVHRVDGVLVIDVMSIYCSMY